MISSYYHLFVCTGPTCVQDGAEESLQALQKEIKRTGLKRKVRVSLCRCLGQCGNGPNMVVYPEGTWYGRLEKKEIDEVLQAHLIDGNKVERLVQIPVDEVF